MMIEIREEHPPATQEKIPYLREFLPQPEKNLVRQAQGIIEMKDGETTIEHTVSFNYAQRNLTAQECLTLLPLEITEEQLQHAEERFMATGLHDMAFSIYANHETLQNNDSEKNVYILINGWTANGNIYSEVQKPNSFTIAEEIMALDKDAVVITVDGNGFGESEFKKTTMKNNFGQYCDPEAYAEQIDFLVRDLLGTTDEGMANISVLGHSMGGVTSMILAGKYEGYDNNIGAAPAFFPTHENLQEIQAFIGNTNNIERLKSVAKKLGIHSETDFIYKSLGRSLKLGAVARPAAFGLVDTITQKTFNQIGPSLIGQEITGDNKVDKEIARKLNRIHKHELGDPRLVSETLLQLKEGVDLSTWSLEDLIRLNKSLIISSDKDLLVSRRDIRNLLLTITTYEIMRTVEHENELGMDEEEFKRLISGNIQYIKDELTPKKENETRLRNEVSGGHYAALFNKNTVRTLVQGALRNKVQS